MYFEVETRVFFNSRNGAIPLKATYSSALLNISCDNIGDSHSPCGTKIDHRDHSVYAHSQWERALDCNAASHWLGVYTEWSLWPDQQTWRRGVVQFHHNTKVLGRLILWCWGRGILEEPGRYHGCWWLGNLRRQVISSHGIEGQTGPCLLRGRIFTVLWVEKL